MSAETKTTKPPIDRETASKLNPLIGALFTEETMTNVASYIESIKYMVGESKNLHDVNLMMALASSALVYELDNPEYAKAVSAANS